MWFVVCYFDWLAWWNFVDFKLPGRFGLLVVDFGVLGICSLVSFACFVIVFVVCVMLFSSLFLGGCIVC